MKKNGIGKDENSLHPIRKAGVRTTNTTAARAQIPGIDTIHQEEVLPHPDAIDAKDLVISQTHVPRQYRIQRREKSARAPILLKHLHIPQTKSGDV